MTRNTVPRTTCIATVRLQLYFILTSYNVQHTVELHTVELLTVELHTVELHTVELHTVELHSVGYVFCVLCIIFLCGPKELIWILEEDKNFKIIYYLSSYAADILIVCCNLYALRSRSLCTFFRLEPARQCCYNLHVDRSCVRSGFI